MGQRDFARIAAVALATSLGLGGCFATRVVQTDTLVSYEVLHAPVAPPAIPADAVVAAPTSGPPGTTWMQPYWLWSGGQYTWRVGRWIPTLPGYAFLQPRWRMTRGAWAMFGGGWVDPDGHLVATPPPAPETPEATSASYGTPTRETPTCQASTDPAPPTTATAAPIDQPAPRRRLDHTVTLGHLTYGSGRRARDEPDEPEPSRADARHADTSASAPSAPPAVVYVPRAPTTVRVGPSYASSAPSYAPAPSEPAPRAAAPSTSSAPAPSSGGSYGGRPVYSSGATTSGERTVRP